MLTSQKPSRPSGFTIVELLIVIVVIGILAAIVIVAFNGIQNSARTKQRNADGATLVKAISAARINKDTPLMNVTGSSYSLGSCIGTNNASNIEPKDLPTTHVCWVRYHTNLDAISAASGINLSALKKGDARGNPYMWDENEGEPSLPQPLCAADSGVLYFTGVGLATNPVTSIPKHLPTC